MTDERECICAKCGAKGVTNRPDPVWCPDCLDKQLKPGQRVATCQECGAVGIEDAHDPFPGICPDCLDAALASMVEDGFLMETPRESGL